MKFGHWQKIQKLHILFFNPRGRNWSYFHSTASGFWDLGRFLKLPYLGMSFLTDKGSRSGTYAVLPFYPMKLSLFRSTGSGFRDTADFQNCHIWPWNLAPAESSRSCKYTLFYLKRSKLSLVSLYGQRFLTYGHFFLNCHIWAWTCSLTKDPEVTHILPFYPRG